MGAIGRADAKRRIKALVDFHNAVGDVLVLTELDRNACGQSRSISRPGREQERVAANAKVNRLVATAARSYALVNAAIMHERRGLLNESPIYLAVPWQTVLSDNPMSVMEMLDTLTNQAARAGSLRCPRSN